MSIVEIIVISIGLAMDAFAASICKGLAVKEINFRKCIVVGLYFGIFQALMPLIGYFLGSFLGDVILRVDHWIAFALLTFIGSSMLIDATSNKESHNNDNINFKTMFPLAIATSIDALAIGVTFAFLKVNIIISVLFIGIITFVLSTIGAKIGNKFGNKYEKASQILGGLILLALALKILLTHLGIF